MKLLYASDQLKSLAFLWSAARPFLGIGWISTCGSLWPPLLAASAGFEKSFQGMTDQKIKLEHLEKVRSCIFNDILKNISSRHISFLSSVLQNSPDWSLIPLDNVNSLPGVLWKMENIKKIRKQKRIEQLKAMEEIK